MQLILNNFSIDEQFISLEKFLDSLNQNTIPMLEKLNSDEYCLLKNYNAYDSKICSGKSIKDLLIIKNSSAYPELLKFKSSLASLIDEPYWETAPKTEINSTYDCFFTGKFSGKEPNCFSETLERKGVLISLEHDDFKNNKIDVTKNFEKSEIINCFNAESISKYLFNRKKIGFSEYLVSQVRVKNIEFYCNAGEYYADKPYNDGFLNLDDVNSIKNDFSLFLNFIDEGNYSTRFSDTIRHKDKTYFEFRCSLSNNREFRIYYYNNHGKLIFLNSILKKSQKIKNETKDFSVKLIKEILK